MTFALRQAIANAQLLAGSQGSLAPTHHKNPLNWVEASAVAPSPRRPRPMPPLSSPTAPATERSPTPGDPVGELDWRDRTYTFEEYLHLVTPDGCIYELEEGKLILRAVGNKRHHDLCDGLAYWLEQAVLALGLDWLVRTNPGVETGPASVRAPDVTVCTAEAWDKMPGGDQAGVIRWDDGTKLVAEVVSKDRKRDYQTKRRKYAHAGIETYLLLDPKKKLIRVHQQPDRPARDYRQVSDYTGEQIVSLPSLPSFSLTAEQLLHPPLVMELRQQERRDRLELAARAEVADRLAQEERQRAEAERQRADRLAALLRAQGIDPDLFLSGDDTPAELES